MASSGQDARDDIAFTGQLSLALQRASQTNSTQGTASRPITSVPDGLIDAAAPFDEWYEQIQRPFTTHLDASIVNLRLVDGRSNRTVPIHRWYSLKEAFSSELPTWAIRWMKAKYGHNSTYVLDPFIGGGTTGVSLSCSEVRVAGVEHNPFIRFVAESKALAPTVDASAINQFVSLFEHAHVHPSSRPIPSLSTLHNRTFSQEVDVRMLMAASTFVETNADSPDVRHLLQLGVAGALESFFALRKDGRALRYVASLAGRSVDVKSELISRWKAMIDDINAIPAVEGGQGRRMPLFDVYQGSALNLSVLQDGEGNAAGLVADSVDTILYSPPYLNNFDYSEIYKIELWMMGCIQTYDEWRDLRLGTIQSHHSIKFPESKKLQSNHAMAGVAAMVDEMATSVSLTSHAPHMTPVVRGYFDHMYQAIHEQWRVLRPGGVLAYVVANSRHAYLPIATDVVLGEIARCVGFEPLDLVVLRQRNGRTRQKHFLRESIVFLRKPSTAV